MVPHSDREAADAEDALHEVDERDRPDLSSQSIKGSRFEEWAEAIQY